MMQLSRRILMHYEVQEVLAEHQAAEQAFVADRSADRFAALLAAADKMHRAVKCAMSWEDATKAEAAILEARIRRAAVAVTAKTGPMRPYDGQGPNSRSKAVQYARWLATRDGIANTLHGPGRVTFKSVRWSKAGDVSVATAAAFDDQTVELPNQDFDPTRSATYSRDRGPAEPAPRRQRRAVSPAREGVTQLEAA